MITNPYCGECGHGYCYTCLVGAVAEEEGDGWGCLRCGTTINRVRRWTERIGEERVPSAQKDGSSNEIENDITPVEDASTHEEEEEEEGEEEKTDEEEEEQTEAEGVDSNEENLFSR